MTTKIIVGQHRSLALAQRHLSQLAHDNPRATVTINSRRDSHGHFSDRGHFFYFSIATREKEKKKRRKKERAAFLISFKYTPAKRGSKTVVVSDLIVSAPAKADNDDVLEEAVSQIERDLPSKITWLSLLLSDPESERLQFKVSKIPNVPAPRRARLRSPIQRERQ